MSKSIDEILKKLFGAGFLDGSKPEDYRGRLKDVMRLTEAKQALYDLMLSEVVGEDEVCKTDEPGWGELPLNRGKMHSNRLRAEQRQKLVQLFGRSE